MPAEHLEKLAAPPIVEVVCGFVFAPLEIDPLLVGAYWSKRREDFPTRQIHPPISEDPGTLLLGPWVRSWLVSRDDALVLQLQHDRLYLNWRQRAGGYPSFSGRDGQGTGLRDRSLDEFRQFSEFIARELGKPPTVTRVELSKIDLLVEGRHWNAKTEQVPIRMLQPVLGFAKTDSPVLTVRFQEERGSGTLTIAIDSVQTVSAGEQVAAYKLETRFAQPVTESEPDLRKILEAANHEINMGVFDSIFPKTVRDAKFGAKGGAV